MDPSAIVITGAEIVTCLGTSREETWRAVARGECGMRSLTALESAMPQEAIGGQALDLPAEYHPQLPREVRYLKWTIEAALREAGALDSLPYPAHRCGFMLGTTLHGMRQAGTFLRTGDYAPLHGFLAGNTIEEAVAGLAPTGFSATTCSACSSSLGSIALGATMLQSGEFDLLICGGYDTISEYAYGGFNSLRLVAPDALKPFCKNRQGMKLGEGYGIVVLERADDAQHRKAKVLARVLGWGESADAHHLTQPHPQGEGAARAMRAALQSAGVKTADIGLVAAHATGTPDNDAAEFAALSSVFGEDIARVPVVGFKSHLGHTLGGAGAVEMILAMMAMREKTIPTCANVAADEVEFANLQLSTGAPKSANIRATLSTSLGFGGANTCVVLGPPPEIAAPAVHSRKSDTGRDVFITGIGVILPGAIGNQQFLGSLTSAGSANRGGAIPEEQFLNLLNARRVRRMSEQVKLALAATAIAFQDGGIADVSGFASGCGAILASQHGSTNYSVGYYREIVKQGLIAANPMLFAEGVPNACSAHLSLMLSIKGACQTIIGTRTSGLDALRLASLRIKTGAWDRAIVAAAEEHCDVINSTYKSCGLYADDAAGAPFAAETGFTAGSAAVSFILESRKSIDPRAGRARGRLLDGASSRIVNKDPSSACADVLTRLGSPKQVISSANGTWIDRAELAALRRSCPGATITSIHGHIAESFSAGPLLALAATLLSGKMIPLRGKIDPHIGLSAASGEEPAISVVSVCTDYAKTVSALGVAVGNG